MEGGEREGRLEEMVEEGEGVLGTRKCLSLWGSLSFDLSLWLRALLMNVKMWLW